MQFPWWTYRIFFFSSGRGKGKTEAPEVGGGRFFIENPKGWGGGSPGGGGDEGPGGCLRRIGEWGGGANIFFGAEMSIKFRSR